MTPTAGLHSPSIGVNGLVVVIVGALAGAVTITVAGAGVGTSVIVVFETQEPSPNHPCLAQDVAMTTAEVLVVADTVVVSRQPPNQPYLTQEVEGLSVTVTVVVGVDREVDVVVTMVVVLPLVVVDSSRQPHQPGVLQVVVLVKLDVLVAVEMLLLDVVVSEPLLSKYFQLKQSIQSSSGRHGGTSSYASMTSSTTERIR